MIWLAILQLAIVAIQLALAVWLYQVAKYLNARASGVHIVQSSPRFDAYFRQVAARRYPKSAEHD